jgi:hypothetical protein
MHKYKRYSVRIPENVNISELTEIKLSDYIFSGDKLHAAVIWYLPFSRILEVQLYGDMCANIVENITTAAQITYFLTETNETE